MECAGNGRARFHPRPVSQPWLHEAVGTMTWTGTPLAPLLRRPAPAEGVADLVFTGADHGIERGVEQDYARSLTVEEATTSDALLVWGCNGVDLPPQHGYPLRLLVPGLVRHGLGQVAAAHRGGGRALRRLPDAGVRACASPRTTRASR